MTSPLELLQNYGDAFRDLVNARVWAKDESPEKSLRLSSRDDWEFICVAMDVIGDAALAVSNFLRFSLNGPTRYDDVGERYLRLYGLLSATYLQQEAALKLYMLMNCPNPRNIKARFNGLEIRTLRHQLASHSVDYLPPAGGKPQSFVPVRIGLNGFSCMVTSGRGSETRTLELDKAVSAHCSEMAQVLDLVYEKSIKTFFRGQASRLSEFQTKLDNLRFVRDGNLLFQAGDSANPVEIRIIFAEPSDNTVRQSQQSPNPPQMKRTRTTRA